MNRRNDGDHERARVATRLPPFFFYSVNSKIVTYTKQLDQRYEDGPGTILLYGRADFFDD